MAKGIFKRLQVNKPVGRRNSAHDLPRRGKRFKTKISDV
jgi:hypothetical protein